MQTFYRFTDDQGNVHIVDSLSNVPAKYRTHAERVDMPRSEGGDREAHSEVASGDGLAPSAMPAFHAPSFAIGFACALVLALGFFLIRGNFRRGTKILAGAALVTILAFGYWGLIRRAAGTGADGFSSPATLIEDARKNVDALNEQQRKQENAIDQVLKEK